MFLFFRIRWRHAGETACSFLSFLPSIPTLLELKRRRVQADSSRQWAEAKLAGLQADFSDRHRYLLKFLSAKSLKIGDKSGLHHLLLRLDFNGFYSR